MQKLAVLMACVLVSLFTLSCSNTSMPAGATQPTTMTATQAAVSVSPSLVVARQVSNPFCPALPPFTAVLNLQVRGDGSLNLFVDAIRLDFVDAFNVRMPPVTFAAPQLTAQFGSTLIRARDNRAFALPFAFGCATQRAGTLTVSVDMRDDRGGMQTHRVSAMVH